MAFLLCCAQRSPGCCRHRCEAPRQRIQNILWYHKLCCGLCPVLKTVAWRPRWWMFPMPTNAFVVSDGAALRAPVGRGISVPCINWGRNSIRSVGKTPSIFGFCLLNEGEHVFRAQYCWADLELIALQKIPSKVLGPAAECFQARC